jgi:hypothetical protein
MRCRLFLPKEHISYARGGNLKGKKEEEEEEEEGTLEEI